MRPAHKQYHVLDLVSQHRSPKEHAACACPRATPHTASRVGVGWGRTRPIKVNQQVGSGAKGTRAALAAAGAKTGGGGGGGARTASSAFKHSSAALSGQAASGLHPLAGLAAWPFGGPGSA